MLLWSRLRLVSAGNMSVWDPAEENQCDVEVGFIMNMKQSSITRSSVMEANVRQASVGQVQLLQTGSKVHCLFHRVTLKHMTVLELNVPGQRRQAEHSVLHQTVPRETETLQSLQHCLRPVTHQTAESGPAQSRSRRKDGASSPLQLADVVLFTTQILQLWPHGGAVQDLTRTRESVTGTEEETHERLCVPVSR